MTWTWEQVISAALVRSGKVGPQQPIQPADLVVGKECLNITLDKLDGQGYALPAFSSTVTFNTVADQASYLLGGTSPTPANAIRPEQIITATVTISAGPPAVNLGIMKTTYQEYTLLTVPSTPAFPRWWAINESWPQAEIFFYPVPDAVYPIILNCKLKWADIASEPNADLTVVAQIPSGYAGALIDIVALEIAEVFRLDTSKLENKAYNGRFFMAQQILRQIPPSGRDVGMFPWTIGTSGVNP